MIDRTPSGMLFRAAWMESDAWGAEHVDRTSNRWAVCECGHRTEEEALACARSGVADLGRTAYETARRVTMRGPAWEDLSTEDRAPWEHAALAVRLGVVLG